MCKYIPANKLITEIKRQQRRLTLLAFSEQVELRRDSALQNGVYDNILDIINYFQQEQVDLDKEIESFLQETGAPYFWTDDSDQLEWLTIAARHFYELGLNARKED